MIVSLFTGYFTWCACSLVAIALRMRARAKRDHDRVPSAWRRT